MAAFVNSYDWRIQQDGDDLLICRNGHGYDEPCRWERYVPASPPGAVPTGEPRTQENILAALDPIRIGAPPIPPGFVLVPGERIAELEAENERLKREADGPFARALKDVMSAYPGFEWHDYPDGITADDIREFFRSDLDETWRIFDASKARIAELEAENKRLMMSGDRYLFTLTLNQGRRIAELEANNQSRPNFAFVQDDLPSAIAAEVMRLDWACSMDADITADRYGDIQLAAERVLSKAIKQGRPHEEACLYKVRELLNEIVGDSTTEAQAWTGPRQQGWDDCCAAHAAMARVALQALDQAAAPAVPPGFVLFPVEPTETMEGAFEQAYRAKVADICSPSPTEHPDDGGGPFCYGYRAMIDVAKQEGE